MSSKSVRGFWQRYVAWRPAYYQRWAICRRWLKNYRRVLNADTARPLRELIFREGLEITLLDPETGWQAFDEIFVHQVYKFPSRAEPRVILDIGANIGVFTAYAYLLLPHANIWAVEADPHTFQALARNWSRTRGSQRVQVFNYAITSAVGEATFYSHPVSGWSSLYNMNWEQPTQTRRVKTINLSTFCHEQKIVRVDYMKMDIEGAEYDALLGDPNLVQIPIETMVLEVDRQSRDPRYSFEQLLAWCQRHYHQVQVVEQAMPEWPLLRCTHRRV